MSDYLDRLSDPFPILSIEFKPGTGFENNSGAKVIAQPYISARDVQNRLDAVVGKQGWKVDYKTESILHKGIKKNQEIDQITSMIICTISILCRMPDDSFIWVSKSDGAESRGQEGSQFKGGMSDAFKRAAVQWGIGRWLYDFGRVYVPAKKNNKGFFVFNDLREVQQIFADLYKRNGYDPNKGGYLEKESKPEKNPQEPKVESPKVETEKRPYTFEQLQRRFEQFQNMNEGQKCKDSEEGVIVAQWIMTALTNPFLEGGMSESDALKSAKEINKMFWGVANAETLYTKQAGAMHRWLFEDKVITDKDSDVQLSDSVKEEILKLVVDKQA